MLNSKCLRSSRNPLWVAAYCFKQLKKAQVFESDICSCVDKILQDEIDVVSYRELAYLLIGVVRIYSKKVEYLFDDCNEVLNRINKFVMHTKENACVETLRMSITVPHRFELDAFDLGILEDAVGGHIASQEEITLKDVLCKSERFGHFSLDKFEEFDFCENTFSASQLMREDVSQVNLLDMDFDEEQVMIEETSSSPCQMDQEIWEVREPRNFQAHTVGRSKPGAITPEFMLISTPAVRDHARFSRKRKTILDGMVVLPNERLKKSIQDASALISNRGKSHPTLLAAQRQSRISSLPNGFYESLIPCYSVELKFLFSEKVKIPNSLEIVQTPGKLDVPESQTVGSPEHIEATPQTPPQYPTIKDRSIEHPERTEIQNLGSLGPLSPHESIETEQSLERDEELSLMEELNSYESLEREQCMTKDDDLVLMNEDINSYEAENSESCENSLAGWSEQTRKVASDLHKRFQSQRQEEVVNFSQVLVGRDRKECAKLFYEILVLRTTSVVDVNQNTAHGDIRIRKLPKLDQTFATDGL